MVGWHYQLDGHELEWAPGDGEGQGSLECCSPWGHKELDMTEPVKGTDCIVFCHTSTRINHRYICPLLLKSPSHLPYHPPLYMLKRKYWAKKLR